MGPNTLTSSPSITNSAPHPCTAVSRSPSNQAEELKPITGTSNENGATLPAGCRDSSVLHKL
ncbi:hypothetical protein D3C75_1283320 [compost metagenome]